MYKTEIITVTPKVAKQILEHNFSGNRKVNQSIVRAYARDMVGGRWNTDACPPISMTEDGTLLDGQHRLYAVINANTPVKMEVRKGVDYDSYLYFDSGKVRNVSDMIQGKSKAGVAAVGNVAYSLKYGKLNLLSTLKGQANSGRNAKSEIVPYVQAHYEELLKMYNVGYRFRTAVGSGAQTHYADFLAVADYLEFPMIELFVEDFIKDNSESMTIRRCKKNLRALLNSKTRAHVQDIVELLLHAYRLFESNVETDRFSNTHGSFMYYQDQIEEMRKQHGQND